MPLKIAVQMDHVSTVSIAGDTSFALSITWSINRHLTFSPSGRGIAQEGARYGGVGIATSIVNYLVYCAILFALPAMPPLAALAIASLVAMALSFLGYSRLVFDR